jgi:hypothetical protein
MSPFRCISLLVLLAAAGCLQAGKEPEGIKLAPGRDIGSIGFVTIDGRDWVAFNRIKSPATASKGSVSDLWIAGPMGNSPDAGVDGGAEEADGGVQAGPQQRLVIADRSDRWGSMGAGGSLFTMVKEQQVASGGDGAGQLESVGTLVRIDSNFQPQETFENVSTFTADRFFDNRLLYRQVSADNQTPGLFLWDGRDSLRLGDVASASLLDMQITDSGMAYFVLGADQVLSRLNKLTDTRQDLHANVSRYQLRGDEKYAVLSLLNAGTSTTVVLDIQAGKDIPLARPNPCCWLGFAAPNLFTYAQSSSANTPAEYHTLDLVSGGDATLVLPAPLVDLVSMDSNGDEALYRDSQGHGVFFGLSDHQPRRTVMRVDPATGQVVPARMLNPKFSLDGRYLLYIDPQPLTVAEPDPHGPLLVQYVEFVDQPVEHPPRQLSTPGMSVQGSTDYRFIDGPTTDAGPSVILFFWANVVRSSSDLYFANIETGELEVAGSSIGSVTVLDYRHIFGTVNVSAQDGTGDLAMQYVDGTEGRVLAHAVLGFTLGADPNPTPQTKAGLVAYVVRGRVSNDHDGLWGTTMTPPGQDQDGGQ